MPHTTSRYQGNDDQGENLRNAITHHNVIATHSDHTKVLCNEKPRKRIVLAGQPHAGTEQLTHVFEFLEAQAHNIDVLGSTGSFGCGDGNVREFVVAGRRRRMGKLPRTSDEFCLGASSFCSWSICLGCLALQLAHESKMEWLGES